MTVILPEHLDPMTHPAAEPNDTNLVRSAQSGDCTAFDTLIRRHFGLVHAIALARLGEREAAEDLAQEVFLRAHFALSQLTDPARFTPWLARITRNLATTWKSHAVRRSELATMVPLDQRAHEVADTEDKGARRRMETEQQHRALWDALHELPTDQRELVLMHFSEGLTQVEIGERLGLHQTTVLRRLRRALGAMRGSLAPLLRESAPALSARPRARARASALVAAAVASSAATRASLAAAAAASTPMAKAGALTTIKAALAAGGAIMASGKGITAAAAVVILAMGGAVIVLKSDQSPTDSSAPVASIQSASVTLRDLVGTWQWENPLGNSQQVSIFEDGRIQIYSDPNSAAHVIQPEGSDVQIHPSSGDAHVLIAGGENIGTFLGPSGRAPGLGRVWRRVSEEPADLYEVSTISWSLQLPPEGVGILAGTWQLLNPLGDDAQITVFPDGRAVEFLADGSRRTLDRFADSSVVRYAEGAHIVTAVDGSVTGSFLEQDSEAQGFMREYRRISEESIDEPVIF